MNILVLNLGSTSFKFELFNSTDLKSLKKGNYKIEQQGDDVQEQVDKLFRDMLRHLGDIDQIQAVGHRVVHGGDAYVDTTKIDLTELAELEKLNHLAPLHNPFNLAGIKSSQKYLPNVDNYAIFDTCFYKDLPLATRVYPIPYKYYEQGIKKFGFHGISHKYAGQQTALKIKKPFDKAKIISVHLGGGCSITAIEKGKAVETSMGFTPLEGLMMQTRCGDVDPGVIEIISAEAGADELSHVLNKESGLKGISGKDGFLELLDAVRWGDEKAKLAFDMFTHRVQKYIGAYMAVLGEVDAIAFTGNVGAGKPITRKKIMNSKLFKGIPVVAIDPYEELAIAEEIKHIFTDE